MNILTLYILKKFLRPFIASFLALVIIIFVSQIFERLDRFMSEGIVLKDVLGYLISSMPFHTLQILPVACLLGTLFVVGDLARNREYVAGLAGGIPPERLLSGVLIAGFVISLIALIANETFVPHATKYSREVFRERIRRLGSWTQSRYSNFIVAGTDDRLWNAADFYVTNGVMDRVVVDSYDKNRIISQIDAKRANFRGQEWTFTDGVVRTFDEKGVHVLSVEPFETKTLPFSEQPSDLALQEPQPEQMNYKALKKHVERLESLGVDVRKYKVELMMKLAFPFTCFIVTLLGIPLALRGKGNRMKGIASAGLIALIYMGFVEFGKALAIRLIPPVVGAWAGNIFFFFLALYFWYRMRQTA